MTAAAQPPRDPGEGADIQDFILARELAEVYLLLDNISSGKSKTIPADGDKIFAKDKSKTWLEQVCEIAWPPDPHDLKKQAANAAKLIRAKDMLNTAAAPATGASIAFTLTVIGESRDPAAGVPWWRRGLLRLAGVLPTPMITAAGGFAGGGGDGSESGGSKPPTRASLAALAYPSFARRALRYRAVLFSLIAFLILWLIVTCFVSWDVATGSSLLNRVNALESVQLSANAQHVPHKTQAADTANVDANAQADAGAATANGMTSGPQQDQADPAYYSGPNEVSREDAAGNLRLWLANPTWLRRLLIASMGAAREEALTANVAAAAPPASAVAASNAAPSAAAAAAPPRRTNIEWAAVCIAVLAGTILPIFYGLLGAAAAVVRSISAKIRDSTLMPRDLGLAYVQLALGAVIGACVGLFVTSDANAGAAQQGLLGTVHLSAPALCFVAGFGVEGVFQALESLMRRVFNIEQPKPSPP